MDSKTPVIVSACRTPIGKYLGALSSFTAPQLGAIAIREAIKRARELQESVLAGYERSLPREHPDVLLARRRLAVTLWRLGDLARARELQESVLATCDHLLEALRSGRAAAVSAADNLRTFELCEAAYEAAATGRAVRLPG